jgi:hypothetical protein
MAAVPAGNAVGVGADGVDRVSVPQLQGASQLQATPESSVPVPDVPQVQAPPVPTPQVPEVQAPSVPDVPDVPTPSTPDVPAPSVPDVPTPSAPAAPSAPSTAPSGGSTGSSAPSAAAPSAPAGGAPDGAAPSADAHGKSVAGDTEAASQEKMTVEERREARDERVAEEVRRLRSCLDALDAEERSVLELRAGLDGAGTRTRAETARELDISRADARHHERSGLRNLRTACGVPPEQVGAFVEPVRRTASMPPFQPPPVLAARTSGRVFVSQDELGGRAEQEVKSVAESSPMPTDPDADATTGDGDLLTPPPGTSLTLAAATTGSAAPLWIALAFVLALMAALALLAARGVLGRRPRTADAGDGRLVAASAVAAEPVATTIPAAEPDRGPEVPASEPAAERGRGDWQWPSTAAAAGAAAAAAAGTTRERERPEPTPEDETYATAATPGSDRPTGEPDIVVLPPEREREATAARPTPPVITPTRRVRRDYTRPVKLAARGASGAFSLAAREIRRRRKG